MLSLVQISELISLLVNNVINQIRQKKTDLIKAEMEDQIILQKKTIH